MATETVRPRALPSNVLRGVDWKTYLRLRNHPGNGHLRMSYLEGTLILVSPEFIHFRYGRRMAMMISEMGEALEIPLLSLCSPSLQRVGSDSRKGSAKEPDIGFYFRENELRMRRKDTLDLEVDPPPDLTIEIDNKADSSKALALYARIGVPEVWWYRARKKTLWFARLAGETYEPVERSINLPRLTPALVLFALGKIDEMGETASKPWLREWARGLADPAV
jgi:Uma2 family endonuclease